MAYAVARAAKRGAGGLGAAQNHNEHRLGLPNVDPDLIQHNRVLIGSGNLFEDVQRRLAEVDITPRANACLAVEFVITASPEFYHFRKAASERVASGYELKGHWEKLQEYEKATLDWFNRIYGQANVVAVNRHMDEKTPHLHVFVVPLLEKDISLTRQRKNQPLKTRKTERRLVLSATDVMGGPTQMVAMQTSFAAAVAHLGLDRGLSGTGARHTTTKQYAALTQAAVSGENVAQVQHALALLGNRRERLESAELREMKDALAKAGMVLYKGQIMPLAAAEQAKAVEKVDRSIRVAEKAANGLKTAPSVPAPQSSVASPGPKGEERVTPTPKPTLPKGPRPR